MVPLQKQIQIIPSFEDTLEHLLLTSIGPWCTEEFSYTPTMQPCLVSHLKNVLNAIDHQIYSRVHLDGKLRLLYECNPASFILERAGGKAFDGETRILDIEPKTIHDRTQIFLGAPDEIDELTKYFKGIKK